MIVSDMLVALSLFASDTDYVPTCRERVPAALAGLARADAAVTRHDARAANGFLDEALNRLGNAYDRPNLIDDTGMHLVLGTVAERRGQLTRAAMLKRRILVERLRLCGVPTNRIPPPPR